MYLSLLGNKHLMLGTDSKLPLVASVNEERVSGAVGDGVFVAI